MYGTENLILQSTMSAGSTSPCSLAYYVASCALPRILPRMQLFGPASEDSSTVSDHLLGCGLHSLVCSGGQEAGKLKGLDRDVDKAAFSGCRSAVGIDKPIHHRTVGRNVPIDRKFADYEPGSAGTGEEKN